MAAEPQLQQPLMDQDDRQQQQHDDDGGCGLEGQEERLQYLDFVQAAAVQALACFARLYDLAKDSSGPLRPGVQSVEGTVKAVVGPVYDRYHGVPFELLKFVDRKVGDSVSEIERHIPAVVRQASTQAYTAAQKAPEVARSVAAEVHRAGVVETAAGVAKSTVARYQPVARDLYDRYEPVAEHYAVSGWRALHRLPLFPQVAQLVVPTAAYWTDKYNGAVSAGKQNGYALAEYLPPVPTEKIAKVFGEAPGNSVAAQ